MCQSGYPDLAQKSLRFLLDTILELTGVYQLCSIVTFCVTALTPM